MDQARPYVCMLGRHKATIVSRHRRRIVVKLKQRPATTWYRRPLVPSLGGSVMTFGQQQRDSVAVDRGASVGDDFDYDDGSASSASLAATASPAVTRATVCIQSHVRAWIARRAWRQAKKRYRVVSEMATTEAQYVASLVCIVTHYVQPLRRQLARHGAGVSQGATTSTLAGAGGSVVDGGGSGTPSAWLTEGEIKAVFSILPELIPFHRQLLTGLESRLRCWHVEASCVGTLFVNLVDFFRICAQYVNNYDRAKFILNDHYLRNSDFASFCAHTQRVMGEPLQSLLIKPVQRLPRYELLLRELLRCTPEHHVDYPHVKHAYDKVCSVNAFINAKKASVDAHERVVAISQMLRPPMANLLQASRRYVGEGSIFDVQRGRELLYVLFNDLLLIAARRTFGRTLKVKYTFPIRHWQLIPDAQSHDDEPLRVHVCPGNTDASTAPLLAPNDGHCFTIPKSDASSVGSNAIDLVTAYAEARAALTRIHGHTGKPQRVWKHTKPSSPPPPPSTLTSASSPCHSVSASSKSPLAVPSAPASSSPSLLRDDDRVAPIVTIVGPQHHTLSHPERDAFGFVDKDTGVARVARKQLLRTNGLHSAWERILWHLDPLHVSLLCGVSRAFRSCFQSDVMWQPLLWHHHVWLPPGTDAGAVNASSSSSPASPLPSSSSLYTWWQQQLPRGRKWRAFELPVHRMTCRLLPASVHAEPPRVQSSCDSSLHGATLVYFNRDHVETLHTKSWRARSTLIKPATTGDRMLSNGRHLLQLHGAWPHIRGRLYRLSVSRGGGGGGGGSEGGASSGGGGGGGTSWASGHASSTTATSTTSTTTRNDPNVPSVASPPWLDVDPLDASSTSMLSESSESLSSVDGSFGVGGGGGAATAGRGSSGHSLGGGAHDCGSNPHDGSHHSGSPRTLCNVLARVKLCPPMCACSALERVYWSRSHVLMHWRDASGAGQSLLSLMPLTPSAGGGCVPHHMLLPPSYVCDDLLLESSCVYAVTHRQGRNHVAVLHTFDLHLREMSRHTFGGARRDSPAAVGQRVKLLSAWHGDVVAMTQVVMPMDVTDWASCRWYRLQGDAGASGSNGGGSGGVRNDDDDDDDRPTTRVDAVCVHVFTDVVPLFSTQDGERIILVDQQHVRVYLKRSGVPMVRQIGLLQPISNAWMVFGSHHLVAAVVGEPRQLQVVAFGRVSRKSPTKRAGNTLGSVHPHDAVICIGAHDAHDGRAATSLSRVLVDHRRHNELPPEVTAVWDRVIHHLGVHEVLRLAGLCRAFHWYFSANRVWRLVVATQWHLAVPMVPEGVSDHCFTKRWVLRSSRARCLHAFDTRTTVCQRLKKISLSGRRCMMSRLDSGTVSPRDAHVAVLPAATGGGVIVWNEVTNRARLHAFDSPSASAVLSNGHTIVALGGEWPNAWARVLQARLVPQSASTRSMDARRRRKPEPTPPADARPSAAASPTTTTSLPRVQATPVLHAPLRPGTDSHIQHAELAARAWGDAALALFYVHTRDRDHGPEPCTHACPQVRSFSGLHRRGGCDVFLLHHDDSLVSPVHTISLACCERIHGYRLLPHSLVLTHEHPPPPSQAFSGPVVALSVWNLRGDRIVTAEIPPLPWTRAPAVGEGTAATGVVVVDAWASCALVQHTSVAAGMVSAFEAHAQPWARTAAEASSQCDTLCVYTIHTGPRTRHCTVVEGSEARVGTRCVLHPMEASGGAQEEQEGAAEGRYRAHVSLLHRWVGVRVLDARMDAERVVGIDETCVRVWNMSSGALVRTMRLKAMVQGPFTWCLPQARVLAVVAGGSGTLGTRGGNRLLTIAWDTKAPAARGSAVLDARMDDGTRAVALLPDRAAKKRHPASASAQSPSMTTATTSPLHRLRKRLAMKRSPRRSLDGGYCEYVNPLLAVRGHVEGQRSPNFSMHASASSDPDSVPPSPLRERQQLRRTARATTVCPWPSLHDNGPDALPSLVETSVSSTMDSPPVSPAVGKRAPARRRLVFDGGVAATGMHVRPTGARIADTGDDRPGVHVTAQDDQGDADDDGDDDDVTAEWAEEDDDDFVFGDSYSSVDSVEADTTGNRYSPQAMKVPVKRNRLDAGMLMLPEGDDASRISAKGVVCLLQESGVGRSWNRCWLVSLRNGTHELHKVGEGGTLVSPSKVPDVQLEEDTLTWRDTADRVSAQLAVHKLRQFCFLVRTPQTSFLLSCGSARTATDWVSHMQRCQQEAILQRLCKPTTKPESHA